ncbi:MAG: agmatinase [Eubacteriales bacterium]|jgi:agmatinase|nr:agmatinase [Eubacteriales bacterium]
MDWGKDSFRGQHFFCAGDNPQAANVILGAPMDFTASFRPGSRFGPEALRQMSYNLEDYSLQLEKSLGDLDFYDAGDLLLPIGNVPRSLDIIEEAVEQLLAAGQRPFIMGGDHLVTLPCLRAFSRHFPGLTLVHIDAHADLREEWLGETLSHATVVGAAARTLPLGEIWQFAIRSATREEHQYASQRTRLFAFDFLQPLSQVIHELAGPLYITLDLDALDPAYAPGTGTPEAGGISPRELLAGLQLLGQCNVIGFDLVELAPIDHSDISAALGAKIMREALLLFGKQP